MIWAVLQEEIGGKVGSFVCFKCAWKTASSRIDLRCTNAFVFKYLRFQGLYITKSQPPSACEFTLHYT